MHTCKLHVVSYVSPVHVFFPSLPPKWILHLFRPIVFVPFSIFFWHVHFPVLTVCSSGPLSMSTTFLSRFESECTRVRDLEQLAQGSSSTSENILFRAVCGRLKWWLNTTTVPFLPLKSLTDTRHNFIVFAIYSVLFIYFFSLSQLCFVLLSFGLQISFKTMLNYVSLLVIRPFDHVCVAS